MRFGPYALVSIGANADLVKYNNHLAITSAPVPQRGEETERETNFFKTSPERWEPHLNDFPLIPDTERETWTFSYWKVKSQASPGRLGLICIFHVENYLLLKHSALPFGLSEIMNLRNRAKENIVGFVRLHKKNRHHFSCLYHARKITRWPSPTLCFRRQRVPRRIG